MNLQVLDTRNNKILEADKDGHIWLSENEDNGISVFWQGVEVNRENYPGKIKTELVFLSNGKPVLG